MDISSTVQPRTDQQNFDHYLDGPKTVTISEVRIIEGGEQPLELHLVEFPGKPYKPNLSMRKVLKHAWGSDGDAFVGRRLTLFGDPTVRFGPSVTGGIKISHMSHLTAAVKMPLTVSKGKKALFTVQPLPDAPTPPRDESGRDWLNEMSLVNDTDELTVLYKSFVATPGAFNEELKSAFGTRGAAIKAAQKPAEEQEELI